MAGFVAKSNRNKLWFGTVERACWFPTPLRGADASPKGWESGGTLLNGGGYQFGSFGSHREFVFEWSGVSSQEALSVLQSYASGSYGRGLIYFHDPLSYAINVLPAQWADPSVGVGYEGASLVYNVYPTATVTASRDVNDLPVQSAVFDLSEISEGWRGEHDALYIPIPEGHAFALGAFYSATGSGGIFYRTVTSAGALGSVERLTELGNGSESVVNETVSGAGISGVYLWIGKSSSGGASVTVSGMVGRLLLDKNLVSVLRFTNVYANSSFEAGSGSLVTVATNLFTNPYLVEDSGEVELARNLFVDPRLTQNPIPGVTGGNALEPGLEVESSAVVANSAKHTFVVEGDGAVGVQGAEVGRNLLPNPTPISTSNGWGGILGATIEFVDDAISVTCPGSTTNEGVVATTSSGKTGLVASGSIQVKAPLGADLYVEIRCQQAASATRTSFIGTGDWQIVKAEGAPASTTGGSHSLHVRTRNVPQAISFSVRRGILVEASTVGGYFDGDTPPTENHYYTWAGTPNASETIAYEIENHQETPARVRTNKNLILYPGEYTHITKIAGDYDGDSFDGATESAEGNRFKWAGTPDDSESIKYFKPVREITGGKAIPDGGLHVPENEYAVLSNSTLSTVMLEGSGAVAVVDDSLPEIVNYAPRIEGSGTWAEVRRNYSTNPSFEVGVWLSQTGVETLLDNTRSRFGDRSMRLSRDTSGIISVFRAPGSSATWSVAPGEQWGISYYVFSPKPAQFKVQARWQTGIAWGTGFTSNVGPVVDVPANEWTRVEGVLTVPATATYAQEGVFSVTSFSAGEPVWIDGFQVERDRVTPYFDGSTKPDIPQPEDFRTRWLGTPNASESVMEIETVANLPELVSGYYSDGQIRVLDEATITIDPADTIMIAPVGENQTVNGIAADGETHVQGEAVLSAGWWQHLGFFTGTYDGPFFDGGTGIIEIDGTTYVTKWNPDSTSTATPITDILPDHTRFETDQNVILLEGDYTKAGRFTPGYQGNLFSGSNDPSGDYEYAWTGAPNQSTSTQKAEGLPNITNGYQSKEWAYEGFHSLYVTDLESFPISTPSTVVVVARNSGQTLDTDTETITSGESNATLRANATSTFTLSEGWWDVLTIVEQPDYPGDPFTGSTGSIKVGSESLKTNWAGTPNDSPSEARTKTPELDIIKRGPWLAGQGHSGVRMVGHPTKTLNGPFNGGQVGFAATFREVGHWVSG